MPLTDTRTRTGASSRRGTGAVFRAGIPPLFFWQHCTLALLAGILSARHILPGSAAAVILLLFCPAPGGVSARARRFVLLLCVLAGFFHMRHAIPEPPTDIPAWFHAGERIEAQGKIVSVSGLPDRRLRILLEDVRPASGNSLPPLPGKVNLSWDQARLPGTPRPLPGQYIVFTSRIRPVSSFTNIDAAERGNDIAAYWAAKDVWFNAWIMSRPGRASPARTEGSPDFGPGLREKVRTAFVRSLGEPTSLSFTTEERHKKRPDSARFMTQGQAMLPALLFGDRYALDSVTLDLFTRAGLVHSLALSGQHLALALLLACGCAALTGRLYPRLFLRMPRRRLIFAVGLPLALLYLWLGDAPPSLIRAAIMLFAGAALWQSGRVSTSLDALFLAGLCFLLVHPASAFDLSVRLSMLSVAGIILAAPLLRSVPLHSRVLRAAAQMLIVSLAAQTATLPIVLHAFGRVCPCFILNLIWLPVLGLLVLPLAALGCALLPFACGGEALHILLSGAALPGDMLLKLLTMMDEAGLLAALQGLKPTGLSMLGFICALAALACAAGGHAASRACRGLLICALVLLPAGLWQRSAETWRAFREERITLRVLDVGQGQSLALEYPSCSGIGRMLLDGGGSLSPRFDTGRDIVAHALTSNRAPRLDAILASHADMDHIRGLISVAETFRVDTLYRSALPGAFTKGDGPRLTNTAYERGIDERRLMRGDVISLSDGLTLEVLHPPARGRFSSNNGSLVLRLVRNGEGLALFCGDAERSALKRILRSGAPLQAHVLVLPHHGSVSSLLPEFYDAVHPETALISSGSYNNFSFPHPDVLAALKERGIPVFNTAECGEIRLSWTGESRSPSLRFGRQGTTWIGPG